MLRFLSLFCEIFAGIFAIISPVAILHWLLRIVNISLIAPYLVPLNQFFDPLNTILAAIIPTPAIAYQGQTIPTAQGLLAIILTIMFFLFNFAAEFLKTSAQKADVTREASLQRARLKKLQDEQARYQKKLIVNRRYLVHVNYDFAVCPSGATCLDNGFGLLGGTALDRLPDCMTLEFSALERAIQYCIQVSQSMMGYYATLRPIEPQPPFRIAIHVVDAARSIGEANGEARKVTLFAPGNQVIFTRTVRDVLEASGQEQTYHFQSMGMYAVEGQQLELFKLFNSKPSQRI